jgi:hypothetical protein
LPTASPMGGAKQPWCPGCVHGVRSAPRLLSFTLRPLRARERRFRQRFDVANNDVPQREAGGSSIVVTARKAARTYLAFMSRQQRRSAHQGDEGRRILGPVTGKHVVAIGNNASLPIATTCPWVVSKKDICTAPGRCMRLRHFTVHGLSCWMLPFSPAYALRPANSSANVPSSVMQLS